MPWFNTLPLADSGGFRPSNDGPLDDVDPRPSANQHLSESDTISNPTIFRSLGTDSVGTLGAWTNPAYGGANSILTNVVTVGSGSGISAGHLDWDDITFTLRANWVTGAGIALLLRGSSISGHFLNNSVIASFGGASIGTWYVTNGGNFTTPPQGNNTASFTPASGTWYWCQAAIVGNTITVSVYNDSSGVQGSLITSLTSTYPPGVIPSTGCIGIFEYNGTTGFTCGGAFANVCTVTGPMSSTWTIVNTWTTDEVAYCWSNNNSLSGSRSLSLYSPITVPAALGLNIATPVVLTAGTNYVYAFDYLAPGAQTLSLTDNVDNAVNITSVAPFSMWKRAVGGGISTGGSRTFFILLTTSCPAGTVYFDAISVVGPNGQILLYDDFERGRLNAGAPLAYGRSRPSANAPLF